MVADLLWIARYQLLEELWRDRSRLLIEPALEKVLRDAGPGVAHGSPAPLVELTTALLPKAAGPNTVWFAVSDSEVDDLQRARPGIRFVPRGAMTQVIEREAWEVAVVDVGSLLEGEGEDGQEEGRGLSRRGRALLHALGRALGDDRDAREARRVALTVPVRDYPRTTSGMTYEELADVLDEYFGGGRIHGLFLPPMAAVVDFGEAIGADEDGGGDAEDDSAASDVPLLYDNTLGSEDPELAFFVAIAGEGDPLVDGMALIELPSSVSAGGVSAIEDRELHAQVIESRRLADRLAIERQTWLEQGERLQAENRELRDEVHELRRRLARAVALPDGEPMPASRQPSDADLAREQTLRWRIEQLEAEVEALRRRPVEELEADVASLRAQLEKARADLPSPPPAAAPSGPAIELDTGDDEGPARRAARLRGTVTELEGLARRLERDERLGALELRNKLLAVVAALRM